MKIEKKCDCCGVAVIIEENSLFFPEKKRVMVSYCPVCKSEIYKGKTDGWFFVQTVDIYNKLTTPNTCVYPMP